jgi:hypothetical protein
MSNDREPRCAYRGHDTAGEPCPRSALPGWTTCARHYTAGRTRKQDRRKR